MLPYCYVVRVNACHVGNGYEFRNNAPFVLALKNQSCFLVHSRAAAWHRVMRHCIRQWLLATLFLVKQLQFPLEMMIGCDRVIEEIELLMGDFQFICC